MKLLLAIIGLSATVIGAYILYTASSNFTSRGAIGIELMEKCGNMEIDKPQTEKLLITNTANRPWQMQITSFDIWGNEWLFPSGVTLKWELEFISPNFETVELYGNEGLVGFKDNQRIELPAMYDGVLVFELTFTNASYGNYSRWLEITAYDPQGEADTWEWQNMNSFSIG